MGRLAYDENSIIGARIAVMKQVGRWWMRNRKDMVIYFVLISVYRRDRSCRSGTFAPLCEDLAQGDELTAASAEGDEQAVSFAKPAEDIISGKAVCDAEDLMDVDIEYGALKADRISSFVICG